MKDRKTYAILALLVGGLGVHRFYMKQAGLGIVYLLFCWTFIPSIVAFVEAIIWFVRSDDQFEQAFPKIFEPLQKWNEERLRKEAEAQRQQEQEAAEAKRRREERMAFIAEQNRLRIEELKAKYGDEVASAILNKKLAIGMSSEIVREMHGEPEDLKEEITSTKVKHRYYYGRVAGKRGGSDKFELEVRLEDGIVSGWKDL